MDSHGLNYNLKKIYWKSHPWYVWMWSYSEIVIAGLSNDWRSYEESSLGTHRDIEETQGRRPCGGRSRYWSYATTSQETPRMSSKPQKLEEARRESSLEPSEGAWLCQHLVFRLPVLELLENKFLLFYVIWPIVISYGSPRKLIQCRIPFISNPRKYKLVPDDRN